MQNGEMIGITETNCQMETMTFLRTHWDDLIVERKLSPELTEPIWVEILEQYQEPHRQYHNLEHVKHLFEQWATSRNQMQRPDLIAWAIWFHDLIYEPLRHDNEYQSALKAVQVLQQLDLGEWEIDTVRQHIEDTKSHEPSRESIDSQIFLDMDLSILGASPDRYAMYTRQIREEYRDVPEEIYRAGRKQVLARFLQREHLFFTPLYHQRYEKKARHNIAAEIAEL